jgi:ubiquinone/menaquinone biosynthesis C-methylase UbiE
MEPRLQRRVQRYGWDLAAVDYEALWQRQLAPARDRLLQCAALEPRERVLDVACGTGLVSFAAAAAVGLLGRVIGVDLSGAMVDAARAHADRRGAINVSFTRMDAEELAFPNASFDVALCALGLMYFPVPARALREMRRVVRPGGRIALAVWGERSRCGWADVFPIVDAEVRSDVCPLFFQLGHKDALAWLCADEQLESVELHRVPATLRYADVDEACDAAFLGGPVALAWSRFDEETRRRVRARYTESIAPYQRARGYEIPGEFVVAVARVAGRANRPSGSTLGGTWSGRPGGMTSGTVRGTSGGTPGRASDGTSGSVSGGTSGGASGNERMSGILRALR